MIILAVVFVIMKRTSHRVYSYQQFSILMKTLSERIEDSVNQI